MRYIKHGSAGIRKDAWTHRQDMLLAEVVLREAAGAERIPSDAFAMAAPIVGRSASACQQRWNGELKNKHWDLSVIQSIRDDDDPITVAHHENAAETTKHDPVDHPSHYTQGGIETIDFIRAKLSKEEFVGYCRGNVLKYLSRGPHKGGIEDYRKANVYLEWMIEAADVTS